MLQEATPKNKQREVTPTTLEITRNTKWRCVPQKERPTASQGWLILYGRSVKASSSVSPVALRTSPARNLKSLKEGEQTGRRRVKWERCLNEIVAGGESTERPGSGQWERVRGISLLILDRRRLRKWPIRDGGLSRNIRLTETNLGECYIFNIVFYVL